MPNFFDYSVKLILLVLILTTCATLIIIGFRKKQYFSIVYGSVGIAALIAKASSLIFSYIGGLLINNYYVGLETTLVKSFTLFMSLVSNSLLVAAFTFLSMWERNEILTYGIFKRNFWLEFQILTYTILTFVSHIVVQSARTGRPDYIEAFVKIFDTITSFAAMTLTFTGFVYIAQHFRLKFLRAAGWTACASIAAFLWSFSDIFYWLVRRGNSEDYREIYSFLHQTIILLFYSSLIMLSEALPRLEPKVGSGGRPSIKSP